MHPSNDRWRPVLRMTDKAVLGYVSTLGPCIWEALRCDSNIMPPVSYGTYGDPFVAMDAVANGAECYSHFLVGDTLCLVALKPRRAGQPKPSSDGYTPRFPK